MRSIAEILTSLSLEEKVAQLSCGGRCYELPELSGEVIDIGALVARFPFGTGQLGRPSTGRAPAEARQLTAAIQTAMSRQTPAGLGVLFNEEGVHGLMGGQATVFPAALGLGATWDLALVEEIYTAVARECRARGSNYVYAPVLDLARDPRWGRIEETFGEDPFHVAAMGVATVIGLQGTEERIGPDRVLACAKHFVGHGVPQAGSNAAPISLGERELRRDHLSPFRAVIARANVGAIMIAYNELDGIPMHRNTRWITGVLRGELGFTGMVTSDGFGVPQLETLHRVAGDPAEAAAQAFTAGIDCEVPEPVCAPSLGELASTGRLSPAVIDRACRNVLAAKNRLGLLDGGSAGDEIKVDREAHRSLALRAAERAVVLLTNAEARLPLDADTPGRMLVCGPNAADAHLGGYTDPDAGGVSVLDGLRSRFGSWTIRFEEGCRITDEPAGPATWWEDEVRLADPDTDDDRITSAVAAATVADIAVVVVGGNEATHREGWWFDHVGDRSELTMAGRQDELAERIAATGTPTIAVVVSAGPVDLRRLVTVADAVVWSCYPGELGGEAIANVLAGDVDAAGRLPVTFPRSTGQIPIYSGQQPSARRGYLDTDSSPLFPFGHGLSYTSFALGSVRLSPVPITAADLASGVTVEVIAEITNTGTRPGSELIRVHVQDEVASVSQPRRLAGFERVELGPGDTTTVVLQLQGEAFTLIDSAMRRRVEPGEFNVTVVTGEHHRDLSILVHGDRPTL